MKLAITNLQRIEIERNKVQLIGQKGSVELAAIGENTFSVIYRFSELTEPDRVRKFSSHLFNEPYRMPRQEMYQEWDGIEEHDAYYQLCYGENTFYIEKATATVAVYYRDKLVHGGKIGDKDTVLPDYPLRVQYDQLSGAHTGKMNFHLSKEDAFFGLGDKSGHLNKRNRRFKMFNRDSLGYNSELSDPLYKSIPFMVRMNRSEGTICGLFFPHLNIEEIDLGVESNYYYCLKMNGGPYGYFVFTGDEYKSILGQYTRVTGRPALPPLFTFGFLGSSMSYTEPENAEEKVSEYFENVEKYGIPCEGMYFSSGYVKAENGERYSLLWNRDKFPDPKVPIQRWLKRGYRICCNIKPGFLTTHPWYRTIADEGIFIKDGEGRDFSEYYWGNSASFVDFSVEHAYKWWKKQLKEKFIDYGVVGIWNDNNEFELEDESVPVHQVKALMPVLMSKAGYEALREAHPGKRPWIISRSGYTGIQRYARTWTGDNVSDYTSLAYNGLMGLTLGLSGVPYYGHDIGGFFGDRPDKNLLIRWCQSAVFQPRFVIHSWNPDGVPTEPWSYPEISTIIANLVKEHYRFMPYIYNCAIESAGKGIPMERPLALEFPEDPYTDFEDFNFMFGPSILVVAPVKERVENFPVYLPAGSDWYDPAKKQLLAGGQEIKVDYPLEGVRYFVKVGSVVPVTDHSTSLSHSFFKRVVFRIFPQSRRSVEYRYIEDDGESDLEEGSYNEYLIRVEEESDGEYRLGIEWLKTASDAIQPTARFFEFELPSGFIFEPSKKGSPQNCVKVQLKPVTRDEKLLSTWHFRGTY